MKFINTSLAYITNKMLLCTRACGPTHERINKLQL